MQKNEGLIFSFSDKFVSDFHRDMEILPSYTPLFVCDKNGRILYKYKFDTPKEAFNDVGLLLSEDELGFYLSGRKSKDTLLLEMSGESGEEFFVLSKTECGLLRGVVCSSSHSNCSRLCDYLEKLCCYKDYVSSFSDIAFSEKNGGKTLGRLDAKMNGTECLLELCSFDFLENEERFAFPICLAADKTAAFVSASENRLFVAVDKNGMERDKNVIVPLRFLRVLVSCLGVSARYSKDGRVDVRISDAGKDGVKILITTPAAAQQTTDMFEKAALLALEGMGIAAKSVFFDGLYRLEMTLEAVEISEVTLAEEDELARQITYVLSDRLLADMIFTMVN